jgi:hypothetical protein
MCALKNTNPKLNIAAMIHYYKQKFSYHFVNQLLQEGFAVDGTRGGLVLGRSHAQGGVYFLIDFGTCYKLMGELEGFEYLLNIASSYLTRKSFHDFNNSVRDRETPLIDYEPESHIRTIDTYLPEKSKHGAKFILIEGRGAQSIVNKHSTKRHLQWIDEINQKYTYQYDHNVVLLTKNVKIIDSHSGQVLDTCPIIFNSEP